MTPYIEMSTDTPKPPVVTVTPETARRVLETIAMFGTVSEAFAQVRIQLMAVRPYSDRNAERTLTILGKLTTSRDLDKHLAQLRAISAREAK